jgi:hypothetical protein
MRSSLAPAGQPGGRHLPHGSCLLILSSSAWRPTRGTAPRAAAMLSTPEHTVSPHTHACWHDTYALIRSSCATLASGLLAACPPDVPSLGPPDPLLFFAALCHRAPGPCPLSRCRTLPLPVLQLRSALITPICNTRCATFGRASGRPMRKCEESMSQQAADVGRPAAPGVVAVAFHSWCACMLCVPPRSFTALTLSLYAAQACSEGPTSSSVARWRRCPRSSAS